MFEIIWSTFEDKYITRRICTFSNIQPYFIGSEAECIAYINNNLN